MEKTFEEKIREYSDQLIEGAKQGRYYAGLGDHCTVDGDRGFAQASEHIGYILSHMLDQEKLEDS